MVARDLWISIGMEVKLRRIRLGMTQAELAQQLAVDSTTISHWERGRRSITMENLYRIAYCLSVEPSDFMPSVKAFEVSAK